MLSISMKSKYGLLALFELSRYERAKPMQIKALAESHAIPQNFLEQVLVELKKAGFVTSFRGSQGGYILAKSPEKVTVYEVLECLEGPSQLCERCTGPLEFFWKRADENIKSAFSLTLADVLRDYQRLEKHLMYSI